MSKDTQQLVTSGITPQFGIFAWKNGKLIPHEKAVISVTAPGLNYGLVGFEGLRFYETLDGRVIFRLRAHVNRLIHTAEVLRMRLKYSRAQIEKAIVLVVKKSKIDKGYIRPLVFYEDGVSPNPMKGSESVVIVVWGWGKYFDKPVRAKISPVRRLDPRTGDMTAKIGGYYANSFLANQVRGPDCDEALMLDTKGNIAEGPGENVFIVKKGKLFTPELGSILPGITRDSIMRIAQDMGIKVIEKKITLKEAIKADEIMFTGTAAQVTSVTMLNGKKIGGGIPGPMTRMLSERFDRIVHAMDPSYGQWITFVDIAA